MNESYGRSKYNNILNDSSGEKYMDRIHNIIQSEGRNSQGDEMEAFVSGCNTRVLDKNTKKAIDSVVEFWFSGEVTDSIAASIGVLEKYFKKDGRTDDPVENQEGSYSFEGRKEAVNAWKLSDKTDYNYHRYKLGESIEASLNAMGTDELRATLYHLLDNKFGLREIQEQIKEIEDELNNGEDYNIEDINSRLRGIIYSLRESSQSCRQVLTGVDSIKNNADSSEYGIQEIKDDIENITNQADNDFYGLNGVKKEIVEVLSRLNDPSDGNFDIEKEVMKIDENLDQLSGEVIEISGRLSEFLDRL